MNLRVERRWKKDTYTIGRLYVDDVLFCNTLEDRDRGLNQFDDIDHIRSVKIPGETAIPTGTYLVSMNTVSPKYSANTWYKNLCGGKVPRLTNVPGFEGILIHVGNTAIDTAGCILVGLNTIKGRLTSSKDTFESLYKKMKDAHVRGEDIVITIE
jgi:hypothetical protein